jgi:hypothetical protein
MSDAPPKPKRRWFQFGLRTLFVLITLIALWLGYYANWIYQRREARKWLDAHPDRGPHFSIWDDTERELPRMLELLGEEPLDSVRVSPLDEEFRAGLTDYLARLAQIEKLFPECLLIDTSDYLKEASDDQ